MRPGGKGDGKPSSSPALRNHWTSIPTIWASSPPFRAVTGERATAKLTLLRVSKPGTGNAMNSPRKRSLVEVQARTSTYRSRCSRSPLACPCAASTGTPPTIATFAHKLHENKQCYVLNVDDRSRVNPSSKQFPHQKREDFRTGSSRALSHLIADLSVSVLTSTTMFFSFLEFAECWQLPTCTRRKGPRTFVFIMRSHTSTVVVSNEALPVNAAQFTYKKRSR